MSEYRPLTDKEIATLAVYGCSAENWKQINVVENFQPDYISNVHFSGDVFLGKFDNVFDLPGGLKKHTGIQNAILHNCVVGNDVYIGSVNNYIANYQIGEGVYIENIDLLCVDELSSFGNGIKVSVMIESGGREVPMYEKLSAPVAYMMAFYRHDKTFISNLEHYINDFANESRASQGQIGKGAKIVNSGTIKNVKIGDYSVIEGAALLTNGTVLSNEEAPVVIGDDVQCDDFIIQSGSSVTGAAILTRCFVGQGCVIGKQFSAIDSLFFANCQGLHGEAVSIFAGPYTVTHHKSTLMLTALYSFMNAGSGTNFSNHMYKLGPVHQGITERGVKTSSNSYIMWPAHIGAFSVVLGRHKGNPDLSDLPFSYLIENEGESHLLVGINLHSAGTIRDVQKWPKRDMRKGEKLDPISFDFLSPYTINKALKGIDILKDLLENMEPKASFVWYQNCKIKRSSIKKGIELYEKAMDIFLSNEISKNRESNFVGDSMTGQGEWVDMAGLFVPKTEIDRLVVEIDENKHTLETITKEFNQFFKRYDEFAFNFAKMIAEKKYQKSLVDFTDDDFVQILKDGGEATDYMDNMILRDAKKEFNSISKTGFGIDGDEAVRDADFESVRGTFEEHPFVKEIKLK